MCLDETKHCILILSNSSNGESIFLYLADELLGETGRVVQPDMVYIRGECEEKATDDDIERYASNQG